MALSPPANYRWKTSKSTAQRMADVIALHQAALSRSEILACRFVAIRLGDGGSDGAAYENRTDAMMAQRNSPNRHGYYQIPLERWSPQLCDVLLWYVQTAYDNGVREDPAHALMIPTRVDDLIADIRGVPR